MKNFDLNELMNKVKMLLNKIIEGLQKLSVDFKKSPSLTIYTLNIWNGFSILYRILAVYILVIFTFVFSLLQFKKYFLTDYRFYDIFFFVMKGRTFPITVVIIFFMIILIYHIILSPTVQLKFNNLYGNLINFMSIIRESNIYRVMSKFFKEKKTMLVNKFKKKKNENDINNK